MKHLQKLLLKSAALVLIVSMWVPVLSFVQNGTAMAVDPKQAACEGLALTGAQCDDPANPGASSSSRLNSVIETVINIFSMIVGVAAVIMIIIGGLKYITSMGDSTSTASAKNTILYAVIGLVVVVLAQVIVRFVLGRI